VAALRVDRKLRMTKTRKFIHRGTEVRLGILLLLAIASVARAQTAPDFSGLWKQDNDRCQPKRSGEVTLHIEHHDPKLAVETSVSRGSTNPRRAEQAYTTDGKVSISTGIDGDEFHTSVVWMGSSLVFSIEEHENGRVLRSNETWSLLEDGATLQKIRERADGDKQVLFFRRQRVQAEQVRP
jgi:hypothetical protein